MKKLLLVFAILVSAIAAFSQDSTRVNSPKVEAKKKGPDPAVIARQKAVADSIHAERVKKHAAIDKVFAKYSRDHIVVDLNGTNLVYDHNNTRFGQGVPGSFQPKWFSRGINVGFNWDFRFRGSRVSFAPGIAYSCTNFYNTTSVQHDSLGAYFSPRLYGSDTTLKVNKFTEQYFEIPLELRIRTNPDKFGNSWKFAVGFKAGFLVDFHTKEKLKVANEANVYVVRRDPDFNEFRVGPTIRVGYSFFNIVGYYGLLNIFKAGGVRANDFSLGISFQAL